MVKRVLEVCGISREQLARDSGIPVHSLWSWITGRRVPSAASAERLASGLDKRAAELSRLAQELRNAGEQ